MRSFKYTDNKSDKFWKIEHKDSSYTVRFGRIGTKGQSKTKDFPTPEAAQTAYDKIIAEKLAEGYVETTPTPLATGTESVLERAVLDDPDDLAAISAYADWLGQEGDPRGEFIQVQLALEDEGHPADSRKELKKRERALLKAHAEEWLGGLAEFLLAPPDEDEGTSRHADGSEFQFARGWLDSIRVPEISVAFARALARAPQARLLRRLTIEGLLYEEPGEYEPGDDVPAGGESPSVHVLLSCPSFPNLRVFHLGEPMEGDYSNCHTSGETAADLVARMPRLEELYLLAHRVDMDRLFALKNLINLRVLQIYHNYHYPLEILAANPTFENLTHLLLFPHALDPGDEGAYINLKGVYALVHSPHLRRPGPPSTAHQRHGRRGVRGDRPLRHLEAAQDPGPHAWPHQRSRRRDPGRLPRPSKPGTAGNIVQSPHRGRYRRLAEGRRCEGGRGYAVWSGFGRDGISVARGHGIGAMPPRYLILANADSKRWQAYAHDLAAFWQDRGILPEVHLIPWREIVPTLGNLDAMPLFDTPAVVRLESPGRDFEVMKLVLAAGASADPREPPRDWLGLPYCKGQLIRPGLFHEGFRRVLHGLRSAYDARPHLAPLACPLAIAELFDNARRRPASPRPVCPVLRRCRRRPVRERSSMGCARGGSTPPTSS